MTLKPRSVFAAYDAKPAFMLIGGLGSANVLAWVLAFEVFGDSPLLLGTALLAYTLGLRHAVDADHIAAIDNVTRALTQDDRRPYTVGLFFALGHSTVVIALSLMVAVGASTVDDRFETLHAWGGLVGTSISGAFLLMIAAANLLALSSSARAFRQIKRGETPDLSSIGLGRPGSLTGRAFRMVKREWAMYPLGFLFGLGFDTATEIGLLAISALPAVADLPIWSILIFPTLFTAGMTLVDTVDGVVMVGACRWAAARPLRRLYCTMTITLISVLTAILVGGIEILGLVSRAFAFRGPFWDMVALLNDNFVALGMAIVGLVIFSWILSALVYRLKGFSSFDAAAPVGGP